MTPDAAAARGRTLIRPVGEGLGALGVDPRAVLDVVITHLHYDHAGNLDLFPRARFHVQDAEMAYCTGRAMTHRQQAATFDVENVVTMVRRVYEERVVFHAGDATVCPGVTLHHLPGHTPGLQAVRVDTGRGPVVLASDASHFWANLEREIPFPIVADVPAYLESLRTLRRLAASIDHIIPGHDPQVLARFPAEAGMAGRRAPRPAAAAASPLMSECGFVGLGRMGGAMARRLLEAGHQVVAYDVNEPAGSALAAHGARIAGSARAVAERRRSCS